MEQNIGYQVEPKPCTGYPYAEKCAIHAQMHKIPKHGYQGYLQRDRLNGQNYEEQRSPAREPQPGKPIGRGAGDDYRTHLRAARTPRRRNPGCADRPQA